MQHGIKLQSKQNKESQEFWKFFNYFRNNPPLIYLSIISISSIIFTFLFNYYLGSIIFSLIQTDYSSKYFINLLLTIFIILIFLFLSNSLKFKAKSYAKSQLSHDLQYYIYNSYSFSNEIEKSTNINTICSNFINSILIIEQNITIAICGIILASLMMRKIIIPITILLILWFVIYYLGNKFVDGIQDENKDEKTKIKSSNPQVENFLASLSSNESFKEKLFQCDNYCHICVLLEKTIDKAPYLKQVLLEGVSTLITAFLIYSSCYISMKKSEDFVCVFLFVFLFIGNVTVHYLIFFEDLGNLKNSSKNVFYILDKKKVISNEK